MPRLSRFPITEKAEVKGLRFAEDGVVLSAPAGHSLRVGDRVLGIDEYFFEAEKKPFTLRFMQNAIGRLNKHGVVTIVFSPATDEENAIVALRAAEEEAAKKTQKAAPILLSTAESTSSSLVEKTAPVEKPTVGVVNSAASAPPAQQNITAFKTKMLYYDSLQGTDLVSHRGAHIISIEDSPPSIELDESIFHPQGGGQASDQGTIIRQADGLELNVTKVSADRASGIVKHFVDSTQGFAVGDVVDLALNAPRRLLCSRLHSAAHILDAAVVEAGFATWRPMPGQYFPEGTVFAEYSGITGAEFEMLSGGSEESKKLLEQARQKIEDAANAVAKGEFGSGKVELAFDEAGVRMVKYGRIEPQNCGGTHLEDLSRVGRVKILTLNMKKPNAKKGQKTPTVSMKFDVEPRDE